VDSFRVFGGQPLHGTIAASGSKNGSLPLLAASLLVNGTATIENVPDIDDVATMIEMLSALGAKTEWLPSGALKIDSSSLSSVQAPYELVRRMRASFYVAGPLLARLGEAQVPLPGGCVIGSRPVDFHIAGFRALGAEISEDHGVMHAKARRLRGARVYLNPRFCSVGATINIMMAAVTAEGVTVIENASREPEVIDCAHFLVEAGAEISGIGTPCLRIRGVSPTALHDVRHRVIPDRMEAGTYLIAGAATLGDVTVTNVPAECLSLVTETLRDAGVLIEARNGGVRAIGDRRPRAFDVMTAPYPGFPTDLQPQTVTLMSIADGRSIMEETLHDARLNYVDELRRMGANIRTFGQTAVVDGVERLSGAPVEACDLRAGAALVIAGLVAEGETEISGAAHIDRGYERMDEKLRGLGGNVVRVGLNGRQRRLCLA
jgi:UDP-N-acetylglucosamine 1-carboxyvinyltransferase